MMAVSFIYLYFIHSALSWMKAFQSIRMLENLNVLSSFVAIFFLVCECCGDKIEILSVQRISLLLVKWILSRLAMEKRDRAISFCVSVDNIIYYKINKVANSLATGFSSSFSGWFYFFSYAIWCEILFVDILRRDWFNSNFVDEI